MDRQRVVITGIGVVSPIGFGRESFWEACLEGRSGAKRLETPWVRDTGLATQIACTLEGFDPVAAGIPKKQVNLLDRTTWFTLASAEEALVDAGFTLGPSPDNRHQLRIEGVEPARITTHIGSGIGGVNTLEASHAVWRDAKSKNAVKRYSLPMLIPNAPAGQVAIRFGAKGECKAVCTACAAGTMALGDAWRLLSCNEADVAIAGGAEGFAADHDAYALMGFDRLRTMSTRNDDPQHASRPFDKLRDGFVLGEGAAVLVLEREEFALARGAKPYAAIAGYSSNCDAGSMMQLDESGESIVSLIRSALDSAGRDVTEIEHANAHGTSTVLNDKTESLALRKLLGSRYGDVSVTALKSMTGHAIGASGAMETASVALSIQRGVITPTINYEVPDPECDVDLVANEPREQRLQLTVKLSYGFGGHNACLILTAP